MLLFRTVQTASVMQPADILISRTGRRESRSCRLKILLQLSTRHQLSRALVMAVAPYITASLLLPHMLQLGQMLI